MSTARIVVASADPTIADRISAALPHLHGSSFDVVGFATVEGALAEIQSVGTPVAAVVCDLHLSDGNGLALLERARERNADTRRFLLCPFDERGRGWAEYFAEAIHGCITTPCEPDEHLLPRIARHLNEWSVAHDPDRQRLVLVGPRWAPPTHQLKEFLTRVGAPFRWIDSAQVVPAESANPDYLPLVIGFDGEVVSSATVEQVARLLGIIKPPRRPLYDVIVVGGGPAGLGTAAQMGFEHQSVIVVEGDVPGGQASHTSLVENYPGFTAITGAELSQLMVESALARGAEIMTPVWVTGLVREGPFWTVTLSDGSTLTAKSVVLATGKAFTNLEVPGVEDLTGRGVYYGASTAEAASFANEDIIVVGGANSAGQAALHYSKVARHVTLLIRRENVRETMAGTLVDRILAAPNITIEPNVEVESVEGRGHLETVHIRHRLTGEVSTQDASGMFVFIGAKPHADWLDGAVLRDDHGAVLAGADLGSADRTHATAHSTSLPGVYVAGDASSQTTISRIVIAAAEGTYVFAEAYSYIDTIKVQPELAPSPIDVPLATADVARAWSGLGEMLRGQGEFPYAAERVVEDGVIVRRRGDAKELPETASIRLVKPEGGSVVLRFETPSSPTPRPLMERWITTWARALDDLCLTAMLRDARQSQPPLRVLVRAVVDGGLSA